MECRYRALLCCPSCRRVFCVPALAGSSVVFHRECAVAMYRVAGCGSAEHADRADVFFIKEREKLEVF